MLNRSQYFLYMSDVGSVLMIFFRSTKRMFKP